MTALVTGASGLIGSHLCKKLAENGAWVIGLTHKTENPILASINRHNFKAVSCDIRDYSALDWVFSTFPIDAVFHFAAHLPNIDNPDFIKANVLGTSDLLDICHRRGVKNFVYASSMSVYSTPPVRLPVDEGHPTRPDDTYGQTKLIGELLCECCSRALRTVVIRFSGVFGVGNTRVVYRFMQSALSGQAIQVDGDGSQSSDFIYVDDAVEGALLALEHGKSGEIFNIGSGRETSISELANMIAGLVDHPAETALSGRPATRPFRFVADISKAKKELGYSPNALVDGLKKYRDVLKNTSTCGV